MDCRTWFCLMKPPEGFFLLTSIVGPAFISEWAGDSPWPPEDTVSSAFNSDKSLALREIRGPLTLFISLGSTSGLHEPHGVRDGPDIVVVLEAIENA